MTNFEQKYKQYKTKYYKLKTQMGGELDLSKLTPSFDSGDGNEQVKKRLAILEKVNSEANNENYMEIFKQLYDKDAVIRMANGPIIKGIDENIKEMKKMYDMAPDVKIEKNIVQFGSGNWIAVDQIMTGTFTGQSSGPLEGLNIKKIQPNGKKFRMETCSLLEWKDNKIIQEINFWDNSKFMEQLGIKEI
ncbi:SnoaL polyketide cyclase [uncultured virus]|nr:SnoaL polyketide cyclase [uncultured virus]